MVAGCSSTSQCASTALVSLGPGDVVGLLNTLCLQADLVAQVRLEIEGGRLGLGAAFNSFSGHKLEESLSGRNMRCF